MMNGNKATMLPEELVKAEMLRLVSLPDTEKKDVSTAVEENLEELKEIISRDWETNALRSRYAREWDKWLYWWNRPDVKSYFGVTNPMGLLLEYQFKRELVQHHEKVKTNFTYQTFKDYLLPKSCKNAAKFQLKKLRDLQKSFEDLFGNPIIHNHLKLALISANDDTLTIIQYFIENKMNMVRLRDYSMWSLIGANHKQITQPATLGNEEITKEVLAHEVLSQLSAPSVYGFCNKLALKQLLRLNVEEDNQLNNGIGRKFDFDIYDKNKSSLEHVHPKSKVYYREGDLIFDVAGEKKTDEELQKGKWLNRDVYPEGVTEHCIGNLVLLDINENSQFKDKPFQEKKEIYFDVKKGFKSRSLLHSISVFALAEWDIEAIKKTQKVFIARFKRDYGLEEGVSNV